MLPPHHTESASRAQVNLYVSAEGSDTFRKARLPFQLTEHSYTILDTSEGAVFLHVNHGDFSTGYGNIYLSDAEGLRFSLSMRDNRRDAQGRCDFEKMAGIEGVYVSNEMANAAEISERAAASEGRPELNGDKDAPKPLLRSKISFDKGGRWHNLRPPTHTNRGTEFGCNPADDPQCSLHVHGITDAWGPLYSSKNAIGLVMATGNVGRQLSTKEDEVHTFFSRDAGLTWHMVREGSHIYEYGDHGAVIVIADDRRAAKEIYYSWDEAFTWNELRIADEPFEIENVVIEPMATSQVDAPLLTSRPRHLAPAISPPPSRPCHIAPISRPWHIPQFSHPSTLPMPPTWHKALSCLSHASPTPQHSPFHPSPPTPPQVFVVHGARGESGVLVQLDFSKLHEPRCKGVEHAGSPSSDYELWAPSDHLGGQKCLLGHQVRYTRRKRSSACFNGQEYERAEFRKHCACAEEDYECDYGFERDDRGACVAVMALENRPPADCRGTYTVSNGYRLVAGDTCDPTGGLDRLPTVHTCPGSGAGGWVSSVMILAALVLFLARMRGMLTLAGAMRHLRLPRELPALPTKLSSVLSSLPVSMPASLPRFGAGRFGSFGWVRYPSSWPKPRSWQTFSPHVRYGDLNGTTPESAIDDELDLGDEAEAEELHEDAIYGERHGGGVHGGGIHGGYARTPQRGGQCSSRVPTLERPPGTPVEGSLLGPEFTSPLASGGRRDDGWGGGGASGGWGGGAMDDEDAGWGGHVKGN